MASQSGKNVVVAYKVEATFNVAPGAAGGTQLKLTPSPGLSVKRALIQSQEIRSDGLSSMPRLGSRMVDGSYSGEVIVGGHDTLYEALMRSTFVTALAVTQATSSLASISTPTSSTIVATNTSVGTGFISAGLRVGDVFRLTGFATAANNNINLRVKAVATHTITVHGSPLTVDAAPDTSFTLTVFKKLKNGATPVKRSFYIDEYNQDVDQSEVFGGCKWTSMRIRGTPDGMATVEFGVMGASGAVLTGASAPYFTTPTLSTSGPLVFADAVISFGGTDIVIATAFELNYQLTAKTEPVIGTTVSPDVFDNDATLSGSISVIRQDLNNVSTFLAETEVALHVFLTEPESEPKDGMSLFVPRIKLTAADAPLGSDGAMIETLPWVAGKSESVTGTDDTLMTISSSAP